MKKQHIERAILDCVFQLEKSSGVVKTINQKKVAEIFGKENIHTTTTRKHKVIHTVKIAGRDVAQYTTKDGRLISVEVIASVPTSLLPLTGKPIQLS